MSAESHDTRIPLDGPFLYTLRGKTLEEAWLLVKHFQGLGWRCWAEKDGLTVLLDVPAGENCVAIPARVSNVEFVSVSPIRQT